MDNPANEIFLLIISTSKYEIKKKNPEILDIIYHLIKKA